MWNLFSCSMWDLMPLSGIKPRPPALGAQSLSHWTPRKVLGHLPLSQSFLSSNLGMVSPEVFSFSPSACPRASKINSLKNFLTIYLLLLPSHNAHHQKSVKACQDEFYIVYLMKSISKPTEPHSSSGYSHSSPLSHGRLFFAVVQIASTVFPRLQGCLP